jgi:CRISPR-associated protein Cas1
MSNLSPGNDDSSAASADEKVASAETPQENDSSDGSHDPEDLLPVRMLNEYAYCPRLFHLMHVEGRWADNAYTVEGKVVHRRTDRLDQVLPDSIVEANQADISTTTRETAADGVDQAHDASQAGQTPSAAIPKKDASRSRRTATAGKDNGESSGDEPPRISRSVPLDSRRLGLTAKLDLVATDGQEALPVETKRGRVPDTPDRCYEPERVQLMAQGLLLREHGYQCERGVLYFAGSRTRVDVPFTPELEARTLALIEHARQASRASKLPPPLDDSPKCVGCSLNGICLPDETLALQQVPGEPASKGAAAVRRLYPARDDALPLYVQEQGAHVGKTSRSLVIRKQKEELSRVALKDISQLVLCGNVSISAQTVHLLCEAGTPIVHLSMGHWFYGVTQGITLRNAFDRAAQFAAAAQPDRCVALAKSLVAAKGANQRTLLRRNGSPPQRTLDDMNDLLIRLADVRETGELLGVEGAIAAHYFRHFGSMLKPRDFEAEWAFDQRNRRPPRDPVNALLSFGYALLTKECTVALLAEGLDPWWGLYHQPRHGRPGLALDIMEPFRPLVADSAVITAVNTGMVNARDFTCAKSACMLKDSGRKSFIRAYEARLDQLVTHPLFDYRCSWRSVIRLQARLLSRWLRGDVPEYPAMTTR